MTPTGRCSAIHPAFLSCVLAAAASGCLGEGGLPPEAAPEVPESMSTPAPDVHAAREQIDDPPSSADVSARASSDPASAVPAHQPAPAPASGPGTSPPSMMPSDDRDPKPSTYAPAPNPLAEFPSGAEQLARVCGRGRDDIVVRALCSDPKIDSIVALQAALGLSFVDRSEDATLFGSGNPEFAVLGHSTSLVGQHVSAINPRAFIFTPAFQRFTGYVVMAFSRGSPFIELAAQDSAGKLSFYLLKLGLACEAAGRCTNADLLTPAIERDWRGTSLYDDEDLKNTILDCRHCHQPDGPSTSPMLRMQELQAPWTHWFSNTLEGGLALLQDFQSAHGQSEDYAGIPGSLMPLANGVAMQGLLALQGVFTQPNEFQSLVIENEVKTSAEQQPMVNTPKGTSATWQQLYAAAATGRFIPPPYHDVKVTDPMKLAKATTSYKDFLAGRIEATELSDIRDVFLDAALVEMSFAAAEDVSGREILVRACSQCHNSRLDQSLSRARFDVTRLDDMGADMKELAKSRLLLPTTDVRRMPPLMFRTLSTGALQRALDALSR